MKQLARWCLRRHKFVLLATASLGFLAFAYPQPAGAQKRTTVAIVDAAKGDDRGVLLNIRFAADRFHALGGSESNGRGGQFAYQIYEVDRARATALDALRMAIVDGHRLILFGADPGTAAAMIGVADRYNRSSPRDPVQMLSYGPIAPVVLTSAASDCGKYHLGFYGDVPSRVGALMATLNANRAIRRVMLLGEHTRYSISVLQGIKNRLASERPDIVVVADLLYGLSSQDDLSLYIEQARVLGAEAILTGDHGRQLTSLADEAKAARFDGLLLSTNPMPQRARAILLGRAKGMAVWDERHAAPQERELVAGFRARYPGDAERFDASLQAALMSAHELVAGNPVRQTWFIESTAACD